MLLWRCQNSRRSQLGAKAIVILPYEGGEGITKASRS